MITHCHRCDKLLYSLYDKHGCKLFDGTKIDRYRCTNPNCSGNLTFTSVDLTYANDILESYWFIFDNLIGVTSSKLHNYFSVFKLKNGCRNNLCGGDQYLYFDDISDLEHKVNKILKLKTFW